MSRCVGTDGYPYLQPSLGRIVSMMDLIDSIMDLSTKGIAQLRILKVYGVYVS